MKEVGYVLTSHNYRSYDITIHFCTHKGFISKCILETIEKQNNVLVNISYLYIVEEKWIMMKIKSLEHIQGP